MNRNTQDGTERTVESSFSCIHVDYIAVQRDLYVIRQPRFEPQRNLQER